MYHYYGVRLIQKLQPILDPFIPFFEFISWTTKRRNSFYFIFPITFFINPVFGLTVLWAAVISESLCLISKTLIQGERPYWWVKEHAGEFCRLDIKQFPSTCDGSSGTPSGHVLMMTSVLVSLYLIWSSCCPYLINKRTAQIFIMLFLFLLSLSRIVIGTHFPHQVILSIILGNMVARIVVNLELYRSPPLFYFKTAAIMLLMGLFTKLFLCNLGICGCRAIWKQKKYCDNRSWVSKYEMKQFPSYLELASILTGAGLAILIHLLRNSKIQAPDSMLYRIFSLIISLVITSWLYFKVNTENPIDKTDYAIIALKGMMVPLTVMLFPSLIF